MKNKIKFLKQQKISIKIFIKTNFDKKIYFFMGANYFSENCSKTKHIKNIIKIQVKNRAISNGKH
jgi:hypothetical protein